MTPLGNDIPEDLSWPLAGRLQEGESFLRVPLLDELVASIPKEPEVQVLLYQSELAPSVTVPWHFHNGPLIAFIVQGEIILQFVASDGRSTVYQYKAGDAFIEPIGLVHRAYNPNPDVSMISIAVQLTPPGRDHLVLVEDFPRDIRPLTADRGPAQPQGLLINRLPSSREAES